MTTFTLRDAHYPADLELLRAVREPVFLIEQGCPLDEEWDDWDHSADHVLALDARGAPVGTGRLTTEHKIGRMAVLSAGRGLGIGAAIMQRLLEIAVEKAYASVALHAQCQAIGFYQRFGFHCEGPEFDEAGIPHRLMLRRLDGSASEATPIKLQRAADASRVATQIAEQARRSLSIASADLDPAAYDNDAFVEAVKRVALSGRGASVRLLIHDISFGLQNGHRLLMLAQRISSLIEIRRVREHESGSFSQSVLFNDAGGWMRRTDPLSYDGEAHLQDRPGQRELQMWFDRVWERAEPDTTARVLKL